MSKESNDDGYEDMTALLAGDEATAAAQTAERPRRWSALRRLSLPSWLAGGTTLTWIGIVLALGGFVLIAVAWGQVAGETEVYLQLPYLVSAGLTGLGLIMVGVTLINLSAKQRDALERDRQIDRLVSIMEEVRKALEENRAPAAPRKRGGTRG